MIKCAICKKNIRLENIASEHAKCLEEIGLTKPTWEMVSGYATKHGMRSWGQDGPYGYHFDFGDGQKISAAPADIIPALLRYFLSTVTPKNAQDHESKAQPADEEPKENRGPA